MQKKLVRLPYCALPAAHKVVALAVRALIYGQRGCSLLELFVVRAAHVYGALHVVWYALKLSAALDRAPQPVYERWSRRRARVVQCQWP